ncbi:MAG: T9SS type A sorting domain-containing protein [Bacteroidales bacterium]|jgi:hypothetical protein
MKQTHFLVCLLILTVHVPAKTIDRKDIYTGITTPILSVTPKNGEFGGVQIGTTGTVSFTLKNTGVSVLKIKKIEISGAGFTLTDNNTYPFEVVADSGVSIPVGNNAKTLKFSTHFTPADIGIQTGKVIITYGLWSDEIYEIPLTGEGLSCYAATVATKGENWAPKQGIWFKYTADKFSIVDVNSCHPHQATTGTDTWELFLYLYSDCNGTLLGWGGEEMNEYCPMSRGAVSWQSVLEAGETIYIFWPSGFPDAPHAREGFYFNINVTYSIEGDVCENAIPLTLPVINLFGNTRGLNDDYNYSPCSPFSNFMDGNDKVYTITLPDDGYLTGNILGAYASMHVLDVCPKEEFTKDHCKAFAGGPTGGQFRRKIEAGTYYVIVSNWTPPQTVDYLLNLSWESVSAVPYDDRVSQLNIYPNPTSDKLTVTFTNDAVSDLTLELINIQGQIVYRNVVKAVYSFQDEIDATRFVRGVYYLKASNGKELKIKKVVIE